MCQSRPLRGKPVQAGSPTAGPRDQDRFFWWGTQGSPAAPSFWLGTQVIYTGLLPKGSEESSGLTIPLRRLSSPFGLLRLCQPSLPKCKWRPLRGNDPSFCIPPPPVTPNRLSTNMVRPEPSCSAFGSSLSSSSFIGHRLKGGSILYSPTVGRAGSMHLDPTGWWSGPWLGIRVESWEERLTQGSRTAVPADAVPSCALARSVVTMVGGQPHTFLHWPSASVTFFLLESDPKGSTSSH